MNRRDLITVLTGTAEAWPVMARAQQSALPVIGFISGSSREMAAERPAAFRKGLAEAGFVEGQNVTVEYHWLDGRYEQLPALVADLVRRRVAVIASPGSLAGALAAKAATNTIPIVFGVAEDPVKLGLVPSLSRPGGNATGTNFFFTELTVKRLALLHELLPGAVRVAALINPTNCTRRLTKGVSELTRSPSARFCTRLANATSMSGLLRAVRISICFPTAAAAISTSLMNGSTTSGLSGRTSTAKRAARGNS